MPRRYVRRAAKMVRRKLRRKAKARVARRVNSVYRFKRLTQVVRLAHFAGAAANTFVEEDPGNIITAGAGTTWSPESMPNTYQNTFAAVHRLSQLEVPGDFTSLFDRYKITGVKATFLYQISDAPAGGAAVLPTIMYATDFTDDNPADYSNMRQKQNVRQRILTANRPFSIFYRPKLQGIISANEVQSFGLSGAKGWISTSINNADHYGLKFLVNNMYSTTTVNSQLEVRFTYYLSMKDPQ